MRRCPACGSFFEGDECPNRHMPGSRDALLPALPRGEKIGRIVSYNWPNGGPVACIVTSVSDEDGKVGLMVLKEHVRVSLDDLEEI